MYFHRFTRVCGEFAGGAGEFVGPDRPPGPHSCGARCALRRPRGRAARPRGCIRAVDPTSGRV
eukprot:1495003-Pyramimonas_sp.AAC.1